VRELCLTVSEVDPDPVLGAHDEIVDALNQALVSLGNLTALRMRWDMGFLPAGLDLVLKSAWPVLAPRLTCLSIWLDVILAKHLIALGAWTTGLRRLALIIEGDAAAMDAREFDYAALVPTLIAPSAWLLEFLKLETPIYAGNRRSMNEHGALCIDPLYNALTKLHLPKLRSLTVDSPLHGAPTCGHEAESLIRLVTSLPALLSLSITPSFYTTYPRGEGRMSIYNSPGYKTLLEHAIAHVDDLPKQITRLALRVVYRYPMRTGDVFLDVVALLPIWPAFLEELWLGGMRLSYPEFFMVLDSLPRHAQTMGALYLCVDFLRPCMLDRIVANFPHLHTLALSMRGVGRDLDPTHNFYLGFATPDENDGFVDEMLGRTYDCALRTLSLAESTLPEAAVDVLHAAFPSLSHTPDIKMTCSFATWDPFDFRPSQIGTC
jgi:hypothetical protein